MPSLPVALGGLGISLTDVAMLYAGIAEGGEAAPLRFLTDAPQGQTTRLFGPVAAYYLRGILDGVALPDGWAMGQGLTRGRTIGFKTGTSYGFRDAWSAGFSNDYTVAVWVGRADGTPRPDRVGRDVAAPILLKLFGLLPPDRRPAPSQPPGAIIASSSDALPPSMRVFTREAAPRSRQSRRRSCRRPPSPFRPTARWCRCRKAATDHCSLRPTAARRRSPGWSMARCWAVSNASPPRFMRRPAKGLARVTVVDAGWAQRHRQCALPRLCAGQNFR